MTFSKEEYISTTSLAKKIGISRYDLFSLLNEKGFCKKILNDKLKEVWSITIEAKKLGAEYENNNNGDSWIVWPPTLKLDDIIGTKKGIKDNRNTDTKANLKNYTQNNMQSYFGEHFDGIWSDSTKKYLKNSNYSRVALNSIWALTPQDWICPVCNRPKRDIVRKKFDKKLSDHYMFCSLVLHHDHLSNFFANFENTRYSNILSRFEKEIICSDCNEVDVKAKHIIIRSEKDALWDYQESISDKNELRKINNKISLLDKFLSLSPKEISLVIVPQPNKTHELNEDIVLHIWSEIKEAYFEIRQKAEELISLLDKNKKDPLRKLEKLEENWKQLNSDGCDMSYSLESDLDIFISKSTSSKDDVLKFL